MPIVTIQITREGATPEQKAALIKGATELLTEVLNKPAARTHVLIEEVNSMPSKRSYLVAQQRGQLAIEWYARYY